MIDTLLNAPLLVFADDWGRHPSSCQHLIRHLLPTHPTIWVDTIGTRAPKLDAETMRRGLGKLRQWTRRTTPGVAREPLPANLKVVRPKMWPWFSRPADRRLNRYLLNRQLGAAIRDLPSPPIAITTLPIVADLMGTLPLARWVYYCVDDFGEWPGLDRRTMTTMERRVVEQADVCISVSDNLRSRLTTMGRPSHLLTHGVDLDFWQQPGLPIAGIETWERPLVVFWGVIDPRMDVPFVARLSQSMSQGTIVLAGPQQTPDPTLARLPRVRLTGSMAFGQLPKLAQESAVLIMPYIDAPVTRAMQPLKLKEYLATGKPTVARDLPANREWAQALDLVRDPDEFARTVLTRLTTGLPSAQQHARTALTTESWSAKAKQFEGWLVDG